MFCIYRLLLNISHEECTAPNKTMDAWFNPSCELAQKFQTYAIIYPALVNTKLPLKLF